MTVASGFRFSPETWYSDGAPVARTYKRDAKGRFASGGSTGGGSKGKTLKRGRAQLAEARGKVRSAKGKLAAINPTDQTIKSNLSRRAQRGAVTKAEKRLTTVKRTAVIKTRRMTGTIAKPKTSKPAPGTSSKVRSVIKPTSRPLLKKPANTIRPYKPATFDGRMAQGDRQIRGAVKGMSDDLKSLKGRASEMQDWTGRMVARAMADRNKKGIDGDLAGITIKLMGTKYGMPVIRRRAERAAALAAKGSEKGKKALKIYGNQMAFMGPGKPKKKAASNIIPGPRNANPPPKKKRGRRKK